MDRDVFAKDVVIADAQSRRLASVFEVLGRIADHTARVKAVVRADSGYARDINVWTQHTAGADFDSFIHEGIRPDFDGRIEPGA